jgi:ATP-dependent exoDNAse (exonuclease V) beta subunit
MGEQGCANWSAERVTQQRTRIERQLQQLGVPSEEGAAAATEVIDTLVAMLTSERGQWLLSHAQARHEWALLDETGQLSVLDYALKDDKGWLVVDYKTGRPELTETTQAFGQRMMLRYQSQLERYCEKLSALDGAPARAALYFPRDQLWFEYVPVQ